MFTFPALSPLLAGVGLICKLGLKDLNNITQLTMGYDQGMTHRLHIADLTIPHTTDLCLVGAADQLSIT